MSFKLLCVKISLTKKMEEQKMFSKFLTLLNAANDVAGSIPYETRQAVQTAFLVMMTVAAIAIIVIVLMQKGTNDNVGAISGQSDTFYGKNKAKTNEQRLKIATFVLFAFILVCAIIVSIVMLIK